MYWFGLRVTWVPEQLHSALSGSGLFMKCCFTSDLLKWLCGKECYCNVWQVSCSKLSTLVTGHHMIFLEFKCVCPFVAGTRRQELGCTRRQYLCDGFCTSVIHIIPVLAFVLFLSSSTNPHLKASEVREFLKFKYRNYMYFCTLYQVIFGMSHITVLLFRIL